MTDKNYRGKHARHASEEDLLRFEGEEDGDLSSDGMDEGAVLGAHAALDMEATRRMDAADKTAVLDFLYGEDAPAVTGPSAPCASADSKTVAFAPGEVPCASADSKTVALDPSQIPDGPVRHASHAAETVAFDPAEMPARASAPSATMAMSACAAASPGSASGEGSAPGPWYGYGSPYGYGPGARADGGDAPARSGTSYVNDGPNAQVVGFADKPGKEFDIDSSLTGGRARKAAKKRAKSKPSSSGASVSPGMPELPSGRRGKKRRGCLGRLFRLLLGLVVVLLLIAAVPLGLYCMALDRALALPVDDRAAVEAELEPAGIGKPYYTLLLGSDSREGYSADTSERSDVIMLIRMDPVADQATIVTVPRDTPYYLEDGSLVKLNEAYSRGGAPQIIRAVSDLTGVPISHYAEVGFSDLEAIVDTVGGVQANIDRVLTATDVFTGDTITLNPGEQTLDGKQAQVLARARMEYVVDQDAHRQSNDRTLAMSIVKSILDRPLAEIPATTIEVALYVDTDVKSYEILATLLPMLLNPGDTTVYSCTGPYAGEINYQAGGLWLCYENPEGWANLMSVVDSGGDPSAANLGY